MKYTVPSIWVLISLSVYLAGGEADIRQFGYTEESPWHTHFTYMLFHNGLLHLGVNISAFVAAYNLALRFGTVRGCMVWSFVSAVIGTRLSMSALPTIGGSGYVYGMFGYIAGHMLGGLLSGRYILNPERIRVWIALLSAVTMLAVPFFVPQANAPLHITCFMLSLSAGGLKELITYESENKK